MSWQGVALKYQLPTPHHTYQWLSSNHADDSQLVAFIRCPVVFPPIGQSTAASLSVIHLGFVFGYHQLLFVIISILKINVFNGSSWWGWDACAFFQGDVLHVKRIDFSASRWISGLKTTCGTSNKSWVGNDSRWMKTLRILTWTCGVFILDSAELLAQEHASRFGRDGPNLCLQRGDVPMLLYILSRLPLLYIYLSLVEQVLWNSAMKRYRISDMADMEGNEARKEIYSNRKVAPTTCRRAAQIASALINMCCPTSTPRRRAFTLRVTTKRGGWSCYRRRRRNEDAWMAMEFGMARMGFEFWIFLNGI